MKRGEKRPPQRRRASVESKGSDRSTRIADLLARAHNERRVGEALLREGVTANVLSRNKRLNSVSRGPTPVESFVLYRTDSGRSLQQSFQNNVLERKKSSDTNDKDDTDDADCDNNTLGAIRPPPRRAKLYDKVARSARIVELLVQAKSERELGDVLLQKLEIEAREGRKAAVGSSSASSTSAATIGGPIRRRTGKHPGVKPSHSS